MVFLGFVSELVVVEEMMNEKIELNYYYYTEMELNAKMELLRAVLSFDKLLFDHIDVEMIVEVSHIDSMMLSTVSFSRRSCYLSEMRKDRNNSWQRRIEQD